MSITKNTLENVFGEIKKSKWLDAATEWRENKNWIRHSQKVAILVLDELSKRKISQKSFAEAMGVSPQIVSKWLKGKENFTLETITKIEENLGIVIVEIGVSTKRNTISVQHLPGFTEHYTIPTIHGEGIKQFKGAPVIKMQQTQYLINANYNV